MPRLRRVSFRFDDLDDEGETGQALRQLAEGEQFRVRLLETARQTGQWALQFLGSSSWGGLCSRASEYIGELGLRIYITQLGRQTFRRFVNGSSDKWLPNSPQISNVNFALSERL
jgi:hypothetical protein